MSLSFPVLVSMVPLYAVDGSLGDRRRRRSGAGSPTAALSNFPIHFFDGLVPRRPTFAINLVGETRVEKVDPNDEARNVACRPETPGPERALEPFRGPALAGGLLRALIYTMQSWLDGIQLTAPGYRDRIVHIRHTESEGGLNLNMDPKVIDRTATAAPPPARDPRGLRLGQPRLEPPAQRARHLGPWRWTTSPGHPHRPGDARAGRPAPDRAHRLRGSLGQRPRLRAAGAEMPALYEKLEALLGGGDRRPSPTRPRPTHPGAAGPAQALSSALSPEP